MWGTTKRTSFIGQQLIISIHVPRVGDDASPSPVEAGRKISIHVPRVGDDLMDSDGSSFYLISIHVPRVGDDFGAGWNNLSFPIFLSTSPVWGTTTSTRRLSSCRTHFYPRPPCGGRRSKVAVHGVRVVFLSTSPVWGTTWQQGKRRWRCFISIHVPRVGDDSIAEFISMVVGYFYPRPPCGGRPGIAVQMAAKQ